GRTVVFSGVTVAAAMTALLVFPLVFLRSFAYAGIPVLALAVVGAVVVLPALLTVLGPRVDKWSLNRKPLPPVGEGFWHRVATGVMRRPVVVAVTSIVILVLLGAPFLHVAFGFPDDRVLPKNVSSHQVNQELRRRFPSNEAFPVSVIADHIGGPTSTDRLADIDRYATAMSSIK